MRVKALFAVVVLAVVAAVAVGLSVGQRSHAPHSSGAASKPLTAPSATPATAFATHAGLAFGTFYRFIYAPYTHGVFSSVTNDPAARARATAAASYVASQLSLATTAAQSSAPLSKLAAPLKVLAEGFAAALTKLKTGSFKTSEIEAANVAISSIKGSAAQAGLPIGESSPNSF